MIARVNAWRLPPLSNLPVKERSHGLRGAIRTPGRGHLERPLNRYPGAPNPGRVWGAALFTLLCALGAMASPGPAQGATGAGEFLVSFGQRAVAELNDSALSEEERSRRFRSLFAEALDIPRIGRFILGRHWRRATPREREDFLAVFEDIALQRFLPMFTGKSDRREGQNFEIVEVRPAKNIEDQVFVYSRVARKEGPPVELTWRIREDGEKFKILDLSVQGLSMALTLREEYGSGIRRWGGVGPLVEALRQKVRAGLFAPPAAVAGQ